MGTGRRGGEHKPGIPFHPECLGKSKNNKEVNIPMLIPKIEIILKKYSQYKFVNKFWAAHHGKIYWQ
jgi:hypothetical protein